MLELGIPQPNTPTLLRLLPQSQYQTLQIYAAGQQRNLITAHAMADTDTAVVSALYQCQDGSNMGVIVADRKRSLLAESRFPIFIRLNNTHTDSNVHVQFNHINIVLETIRKAVTGDRSKFTAFPGIVLPLLVKVMSDLPAVGTERIIPNHHGSYKLTHTAIPRDNGCIMDRVEVVLNTNTHNTQAHKGVLTREEARANNTRRLELARVIMGETNWWLYTDRGLLNGIDGVQSQIA